MPPTREKSKNAKENNISHGCSMVTRFLTAAWDQRDVSKLLEEGLEERNNLEADERSCGVLLETDERKAEKD